MDQCFTDGLVCSGFLIVLSILFVIESILKGFALWRSAANGQKKWFICIFIFNTAGVLPLIYLLTNKKK